MKFELPVQVALKRNRKSIFTIYVQKIISFRIVEQIVVCLANYSSPSFYIELVVNIIRIIEVAHWNKNAFRMIL